MPSFPEPGKHEKPHTYVVQDRNNDEELLRLTIQDHATTHLMGGVLPEQPDPSIFRSVLDVGCGTGGWAIELAQQYPTIQVVGIDISERMIRYAQQRAEEAGVADRVTFQIMDALQGLAFREHSFDLVNERASSGYVRTWEWQKFLEELQRVARPSGVVRITEGEMFHSNAPALGKLCELPVRALHHAGHFFEPTVTGIIDHLKMLMKQTQYVHIHQRSYVLEYETGTQTPEAQAFSEDIQYLFRTIRPFLRKFGGLPDDYTALYQQAVEELQQPGYVVRAGGLTVWGTKRDHSVKSPTRLEYTLPAALNPGPTEMQSTYFVYDRTNQSELHRLQGQDQLVTEGMGGVLPEQSDAAQFRLVLDVGCGTGGWAVELARQYPTTRVAGVDINSIMVRSAREQAEQAQVAERVKIYLMDTLRHLEFRDAIFDLVNVRFCVSYVRTWEWEKLLGELQRVLRPGGIVRITEPEIIHESQSPALLQLNRRMQCAFERAGNFFEDAPTGITAHLAEQLKAADYRRIETRTHRLEYHQGTPAWQAFYDDIKALFRTTRPFLQKRGCAGSDYDALYQQALQEIQQPDFSATWQVVTAWGAKYNESLYSLDRSS